MNYPFIHSFIHQLIILLRIYDWQIRQTRAQTQAELDKALKRIEQLEAALMAADAAIPPAE